MDIKLNATAANAPISGAASRADPSPAANFAGILAQTLDASKTEFISGRIGITLDRRGQPAKVTYFDQAGIRLTASAFTAASILEHTQKFGIDLNDLTGLGQQLDAAGIGYRPYELYKGTGSDHGVDFADLIAGGLGAAYDWRHDKQAAAKGYHAPGQQLAAQALAHALSLVRNPEVTHDRGIDPARFAPQSAGSEAPRTQVMFNGHVAAWYPTTEGATAAAAQYRGHVLDLTQARSSPVAPAPAPVPTMTASLPGAPAAGALLASQLQSLLAARSLADQRSALDGLIATLTALRNATS